MVYILTTGTPHAISKDEIWALYWVKVWHISYIVTNYCEAWDIVINWIMRCIETHLFMIGIIFHNVQIFLKVHKPCII